jgi:hypothetical protein
MALTREGEDPNSKYYRGARVYTANSVWWFGTREGVKFGPYIRKLGATCSLAVYIAQHVHESAAPNKAETIDRPGAQDKVANMVEEIVEVLRQHRDFGETAAINWAQWRLEDLRYSGRINAETLGRIRVLEFSLRHPQQTFDFEYFLKCRVG